MNALSFKDSSADLHFQMDLTVENLRAYTFIEMRRGETPTVIHQKLQEAGIPNTPSRATVFRWCKDFKEGIRTSLSDEPRSGRPSTSITSENVEAVRQIVTENPRQSLRMIGDKRDCSKDTVRTILTQNLGLKKLCSVWVPHELSVANKKDRIECAASIIKRIDENSMSDCLRYWTTEDETWVTFKGLPTKSENRAWIAPNTPRPRVVLPKLTKKKTMLLVAFTGDGKSNIHATANNETVSSERYINFIKDTGEKWRRLRSSPTRLSELWWQHDNARPHCATQTREFLEKRNVTLIRQSAYSPDMNLADRWLFQHLKKDLRRRDFDSYENVQMEALRLLRSIPQERFQHELERLHAHCTEVIRANGDYVV